MSRLPIFALRGAAVAGSLALRVLALANVAYLAWHLLLDVFEGTQTAPARAVAIGLALFSGLPWIAARALDRTGKGTLAVEGDALVVDLGRTRFEIPIAQVREVRGSRIPWPRYHLTLILKSERAFERRLASPDPSALADALTRALPEARQKAPPGPKAFAEQLEKRTARPLWLTGVKWTVPPLALAIIAFRLQQIVGFGGPFGQYRLQGPGPYLLAFLDVWIAVLGDLVVYATGVRCVLEIVAASTTWLVPRQARPVRFGAEALAFIAFFVVVPAFLVSRLLG